MEKIIDCWLFCKGLNKYRFQWHLLPHTIKILAATDTTGIVLYHGVKYYVSHDYSTDTITIERY